VNILVIIKHLKKKTLGIIYCFGFSRNNLFSTLYLSLVDKKNGRLIVEEDKLENQSNV